MSQPYKACPKCQEPAALAAATCARCGHGYRTQFAPDLNQTQYIAPQTAVPPSLVGTQSATAAMLLSLFIPGGGQCYNGQHLKSVMVFLSAPALALAGLIILYYAVSVLHSPVAILTPLLWLAIPILWIAQVIDAAIIARRINRAERVKPMQWF